ncbi:MAG: UTRA domain-containing protein [Oceanospirillaceae bacterium]|nr:UTRA domain-containing protein [Oceanospirillaceae bacterium]
MKDLHIPYYIRLRDTLAEQIAAGAMAAHDKLPSERELKESYDINRVTVRQALMQLESEGLVYRLIRRGWYVSPPRLNYDPTNAIGFMQNVSAQGRVPSTVILSKSEIVATQWAREKLQLGAGEKQYLLRRRRLIDGHSVLVEHIHINAKLCSGLLDLTLEGSLTEVFKEQFDLKIARVEITMYPAPLPEAQADELQVIAGTPGLLLMRSSYDQHDNVVTFDQEFWRHDALQISLQVNN